MRLVRKLPLVLLSAVLAIVLGILVAVQSSLRTGADRSVAVGPRSGGQAADATATSTETPELAAAPAALATPDSTAPFMPTTAATGQPSAPPATSLEPAAITAIETTAVAGDRSTPTALPSGTPTEVSAIVLPGRFEAEDYRAGGEGVGYHDWTRGNAGAVYRSGDVDIERCTDGPRCYNVGWLAPGEWLAYDVSFARSGRYTFVIRVAAQRGGRFHIELDGVDVTGPLQVPRTGGYTVWKDVVRRNVSVAAGSYELRLVADSGGFNWNYVIVTRGSTGTPTPTRRR